MQPIRGAGRLVLKLASLLASVLCASAFAQSYPSKPITFVGAFPAGSAAEILGRIIGQRLHEAWGQPIVIEARAGAGGTIGGDFVAKEAPDGYTILVGSSAETAVGVSLYKKIPYDTLRDFAPVIALGP